MIKRCYNCKHLSDEGKEIAYRDTIEVYFKCPVLTAENNGNTVRVALEHKPCKYWEQKINPTNTSEL